MTATTTFRVTNAATAAFAERQIRRLTRLLQVPSVTGSNHTSALYRDQRDQWQSAIANTQQTGGTR